MGTKVLEGAPGIEPGTSRSAVECSTTELYPQYVCLSGQLSMSLLDDCPIRPIGDLQVSDTTCPSINWLVLSYHYE